MYKYIYMSILISTTVTTTTQKLSNVKVEGQNTNIFQIRYKKHESNCMAQYMNYPSLLNVINQISHTFNFHISIRIRFP